MISECAHKNLYVSITTGDGGVSITDGVVGETEMSDLESVSIRQIYCEDCKTPLFNIPAPPKPFEDLADKIEESWEEKEW